MLNTNKWIPVAMIMKNLNRHICLNAISRMGLLIAFVTFLCAGCQKTDNGIVDCTACDCDAPISPMTSQIVFSKPWEGGLYLLRENQAFKIREDTVEDRIDLPKYMRWSPDGTKIVYRAGHGDSITIIYTNGKYFGTPVSGCGTGNCLFPAWSPDGEQIAYCVTTAEGFEIRRVKTDGLHDTLVAWMEGKARALDWSPDGERFLCVRKLPDAENNETLIIHIDGVIEQNLGVHAEFPRWSPDGTRIVYANSTVPFLGRTFTMLADGSGIRAIADGIYPDWSADGSQIVYYNSGLFCRESGFCVVDADGSNPKKILDGAGWYADWY